MHLFVTTENAVLFSLCVPAGQEAQGRRRLGAAESEPALPVLVFTFICAVPRGVLPAARGVLRSVQSSGNLSRRAKRSPGARLSSPQAFLLAAGQPSEAIASQQAPCPSRRSWPAREPPLPCSPLAPEAEPQPGQRGGRGCRRWQRTARQSQQPEILPGRSGSPVRNAGAFGLRAGRATWPFLPLKAAVPENCSQAAGKPGGAPQARASPEPSAGRLGPVPRAPRSQQFQVGRAAGRCCRSGHGTRGTVWGSQGWSSARPAVPSGTRWICLPVGSPLQNTHPRDGNTVMGTGMPR